MEKKEIDKIRIGYKDRNGVKQVWYVCNKCGERFLADDGIDKGSALCTPCWRDYVNIMHSNFVSVEDKVRISTELSKLDNK